MDVVDALDAAAAAKSKEERLQLNQQQGKILQWLRHKLPTNADLAQVAFMPCSTHSVLHKVSYTKC